MVISVNKDIEQWYSVLRDSNLADAIFGRALDQRRIATL